jgi:hypothetical protein
MISSLRGDVEEGDLSDEEIGVINDVLGSNLTGALPALDEIFVPFLRFSRTG